jgi:glycogen debranching enzyme
VLTSSILYPVFTDLCRDRTKIKRVIEEHILNPAEFNGHFPIPTVAYNDPRYYHDKPPFEEKSPAGLWRGNIWMPETWIIVKGLYKYGYEKEAKDIASRLIEMMSNQSAFPIIICTWVGRVTPCAPQSLCGRAAGRGLR